MSEIDPVKTIINKEKNFIGSKRFSISSKNGRRYK